MTEDVIGGYRLVRRLGEGPRADVYLGHPTAATPGGGQVAVKVYRADVPPRAIAAELHALSEAAGPHVVAVEDVATVNGRPVPILERLRTKSLAELLTQRGAISVGEAITILVPLAQVVARLQARGVAHGQLTPASVLFSETGAPVLARFGSATCFGSLSPAQREAQPAMVRDLECLREVARVVLEAARERELWAWLENASLDSSLPTALCERLFALGPAEAVALDETRVSDSDAVRVALLPARPRGRAQRLAPIGEAGGWMTRAMVSGSALVDRIRQLVAPVRARFWVIGAGALATLVLALVLVPEGASDATSDAVPSPRPSASPTPEPVSTEEGADASVTGDDPVAALRTLLRVRAECLSAASILCLDDVAQPGSSAMGADQDLVRDLQNGAAPTGSEGAPAPTFAGDLEFAVEEQLGGTALVSVTGPETQPASVLMIRSEAGWRIRDYIG